MTDQSDVQLVKKATAWGMVGTVLFLAGCFAVGMGIAVLLRNYMGQSKTYTQEIDRTKEPLPAVRGVHFAAGAFDGNVAATVHANMVGVAWADLPAVQKGLPKTTSVVIFPQATNDVGTVATNRPEDVLCIRWLDNSGNYDGSELPTLAPAARKVFGGKLMVAMPFDQVARVRNLHLVEYIGLYGQVPLSLKRDPDLHALRIGWQNQIDTAESIARRNGCKIILLDINMDPAVHVGAPIAESEGPRPDLALLAYEALLLETRGRDSVAGVLLGWPPKLQREHEKELKTLLSRTWAP